MEDQTYQIKDYVHDEVVAFAAAMNPKGKITFNEDEMYSTDHLELESYNPEDTIPVATFLLKKYYTKLIYFYVSSFTEPHWEAAHQEVYSLFSIQWDEEWSRWEKVPWYCCSVISEQLQPALHKEAAAWMLKRITTKGCYLADASEFKKNKLDVLI